MKKYIIISLILAQSLMASTSNSQDSTIPSLESNETMSSPVDTDNLIPYLTIGCQSQNSPTNSSDSSIPIININCTSTVSNTIADQTPDIFSFNDKSSAELSTEYSSEVIISGIDSNTPISISGNGQYEINSSNKTNQSGMINSGDKVKVYLTSSSSYNTEVNTTLTIGTLTDTFSVTTKSIPIPTPTPTQSSGGSSNGSGSFLTIDSNDVNENSGLQAEYKINYTSDILKEIIDNTNSKTIQAKEFILSGGKTSQTKIEVPKDTTNVNLKATVEVNENSQKDTTTLNAGDKVQITLSSDGGFNSKVTNSDIEAEVNVNANAEATTKIIVQRKVEVTMKSPKGSEISQENSGRVSSKTKIEADTGEVKTKPIEVEMSAEVSGNLITTANITNNSGKVSTFKLSLPANITSGDMELIKNDGASNIYSAIKSNFKTSSNFKVTDKSKRAVISGENIEIVGTSAWQKFEEKQYFDGKRTIALLLGSAKVIKDGEESELIKGVEYELLPPSDTTNIGGELTQIYNNSYLNIQKGWNLISNPIDKPLNIKDTFKYAITTYKYDSGWIKDVEILNQNEGLWVNYTRHVSEKIKGETYYEDFTNLNNGWNLLGVGRDINSNELSQFNEIWAYDSKVKVWVKNPTIIYRGYGFWGKF